MQDAEDQHAGQYRARSGSGEGEQSGFAERHNELEGSNYTWLVPLLANMEFISRPAGMVLKDESLT
jgi:hypothetical protein